MPFVVYWVCVFQYFSASVYQCFSHWQQRLYGAAMASSVAGEESLRERCTRYRHEKDIAYSDVDHFKDANARLSATVRDLEANVARLRQSVMRLRTS